MELKRDLYQKILKWRHKKNKKPLIIDGLRQVGKTYLCVKLGKEEYDNYILYDFRHDSNLSNLFYDNGKISVDSFISNSIVYFNNQRIIPKKTLLIFDEINDSAVARESLKLFSLDGRYDVVATGSLLGISDLSIKHIPSGYDEYLTLKPLNFIEFIQAQNISDLAFETIRSSINNKTELNDVYLNILYSHFLRYIIVGGMPSCVIKYIETNNLLEVRQVQDNLIKDYIADFGIKYREDGTRLLDATLLIRISRAFSSIPDQLAKENKKFKYSVIEHGGRSSEFSDALQWLEKTGLIVRSYNLRAIESPLKGNAISEEFKVFLTDIGLLVSLFPISLTNDLLSGELGAYKGAIYEAIVADMLYKGNKDLYYYSDTKKHLENDFIVELNDGIDVLETKANNGRIISAKKLAMNETSFRIHKVYKLIKNGYGKGEFFESFPHYLLPFFLENQNKKIESKLSILDEIPTI